MSWQGAKCSVPLADVKGLGYNICISLKSAVAPIAAVEVEVEVEEEAEVGVEVEVEVEAEVGVEVESEQEAASVVVSIFQCVILNICINK